MTPDLLKILANSNKDIDNQQLMDYLAGHLSPNESHEVEEWMAGNQFASDAVEGLQQVKNKKDIGLLVEQLNKDLNRKLEQKKSRKEKRKLPQYSWLYFTIILILLLLVITWLIIQYLRHGR